ncbi:MAG: MBL fold metallo-hydrolase [Actinomycetales bacterium]|nr:MBL fold metallo-hydrolase [Actinomycetales bacterium]
MLIRTVVAPLLGTNCYLVPDGDRCVVVDPGGGAAEAIRREVAAAGLVPTAVLVTHGHVDHTWAAAEVSDAYGIPVLVHEADAYRLADPVGSLGPLGRQLAAMAGDPAGPPAPSRLEPFATPPGEPAVVVGNLRALHAPGHTEGSTVYLLDGPDGAPVALTGDVLFAGSIGRCDLPGGDEVAMAATLRRLAALDPATAVLPGHGPRSTIGDELATNPYLRAGR